jgi:microcystin-dependent protein
MGAYNIVNPASMVAGQPEDVSQVLANFQAIQTIINGGIDDTNIAAAAGLQLSKLGQSGATSGQVATWSGTAWAPAAPTGGSGTIPTGAGMPWFAAAAPTGFLLCDGTAVSRTTYSALFALIATTYGAGDGSTTFNLPDMRGRVPTGFAASGGHSDVATLGLNDGVALASRRPKHNSTNGLTLPNHAHSISSDSAVKVMPPGSGGVFLTQSAEHSDLNVASMTVGNPTSLPAIGGTIGPGGTAANDAPSYLVINWIIKT